MLKVKFSILYSASVAYVMVGMGLNAGHAKGDNMESQTYCSSHKHDKPAHIYFYRALWLFLCSAFKTCL